MSTQAPVETETVSGQVVGVITKPGDKWQIEVSTGGQYTRRLWTKDAALVNQMQGAVGQSFDFVCGVSHWQGQTGPVRSLWVNSVAMFGSTPAAPLPTQQPTQGQQLPAPTQGLPSLSPMEKEERILREHAMNMAVLMINQMPPEERSLPGLVNVAEGLIRYYREGPSAVNGKAAPAAEQQMPEPVQGEIPAPHPDDDIPF